MRGGWREVAGGRREVGWIKIKIKMKMKIEMKGEEGGTKELAAERYFG